jgi:hypothetical protein
MNSLEPPVSEVTSISDNTFDLPSNPSLYITTEPLIRKAARLEICSELMRELAETIDYKTRQMIIGDERMADSLRETQKASVYYWRLLGAGLAGLLVLDVGQTMWQVWRWFKNRKDHKHKQDTIQKGRLHPRDWIPKSSW